MGVTGVTFVILRRPGQPREPLEHHENAQRPEIRDIQETLPAFFSRAW